MMLPQKVAQSIYHYCSLIVVLILLVTSTFKLASVFPHLPLWLTDEPISGIPFRIFLIAGAIFEIALALLIFAADSPTSKIILQTIPCILFLSYRMAYKITGIVEPCTCLGVPGNWWPWLATHQESISKLLLITMILATATMAIIKLILGHATAQK